VNTWDRNPQSIWDEHDWVFWFADFLEFRNVRWNVHADGIEYSASPERTRISG
jgi:hypothetical protein